MTHAARAAARNLGRGAAMLFALSLLTFAMADWAPGDYLDTLRTSPDVRPETVRAWEQRLQLDRPWLERYWDWLGSAASGQFGVSLAYGLPVRQLLEARLWRTLWPNLLALGIAWGLALGLGYWCARAPGRAAEAFARTLEAVLFSFPDVLLALGALWLAVRTGWLPADSPALFVVALTLNALPGLATHARSSLGEAWRSDCAAAARLLGIARMRLAVGYVLPLAAAPLVTLAGISFGRALSGSLVMEVALGWPGLGSLLMDSIQSRDTPVVAAVVGVSGAMLLAANLAADTLRTIWNRRLPR